MNNYQFFDLLLEQPFLFLSLVIGSSIIHFFLFRCQVKSILDPYFLAVVSSVFCLADVVLLFITNNTSLYVFSNYILTQIAFLLGLYTFQKKKISFQIVNAAATVDNYTRNSYKLVAFYFFSFVYLLSQITIYRLKGIPLYMDSRLETFADGGGSGILGRITDVTSIFSIYLFFCVIKLDKFRPSEIPKYLVLSLIFITFLLSGSKGNFFVVLTVFWCFIVFGIMKRKNHIVYLRILKKNLKLIVAGCLVVVSSIIFIQIRSNVENVEDRINPVLALGLRFIHSGDVFWYAYANDVYKKIPNDKWFSALFTDPLGFLRIMNWDELPEAIGITLKNIHHPSDVPSGPNARHNVFGLVYYGFFGSIVFSYLIGFILGFVRNTLPYLLKGNILGGFIFTYLMVKIAALDADPMLTMTYVTNLIFIFPIIYLIYLFFIELFKITPLQNEKQSG